ncbi:hypothetical protein QPK31_07775 [Massilia sp. YIM B02769]|uniref:hypothetical protein n=1 Tax=Massilia sp. YIM B02769 TaxID=3050129 RepID=UPI0025B64BF4|nr:hypothetical protein [Massilia sp. YIM B02769]MDN4058128.1 hypothetical protein [Massilia sp. YIM B02769]
MKKISDYRFYDSWVLDELDIRPDEEFLITNDIGDLKEGQRVTFVGFDDVDNHYGIFVFVDADDKVLEVPGDFSGPRHSSMTNLKLALSKMPRSN